MANKRAQLGIALVAVLLALGAAFAAYRGLQSALRPVRVVEAVRQVPPMTAVTAADVTVTQVPRGQLGRGQRYFYATSGLVGRFTLYGLYPGEIVSPVDIAPYSPDTSPFAAQLDQVRKQAGQALAAAETAMKHAYPGWAPPSGGNVGAQPPVPAGSTRTTAQRQAWSAYAAAAAADRRARALQAVTLSISEDKGFAIVRSGDRVTIYGTVSDQQKDTVAYAVANDVLVLGRLGGGSGGALNGAVSGTLVLALASADVERLLLAEQSGTVQVVLMPLGAQPLTIGTVSTTQLLGGDTRGTAPVSYPTVTNPVAPGAVVPAAGIVPGQGG